MTRSFEPDGIRLGIARGITYGLFGPPHEFVPQARALGAGLIRAYVYWSQVEPRPGTFDWTVVDSLLGQLAPGDEAWITVCSSSPWATRRATDFLPPSPPLDAAAYERFVRALVARGRGGVQYWQCENEPSNTDLLWAGTPEEYAAHLRAFHRAVRATDPAAAIVLGGCGYDVLSSPPDGAPWQFFAAVLDGAPDAFDLFAVHLYDDPRAIVSHVEAVRRLMRDHGGERPVVVGEYNGPTLFELPRLDAVVQQTMAAAFAGTAAADLSTGELAAAAATETPERRALRALYQAMPDLPASLQMFMAGCPPELDELRDRINCREIVTRNLLALSTGVRRTVCWHLAPEVGNYEDPFTMMALMHGKLPLLRYEGGELDGERPPAAAFRRLAAHLDGAMSVERITLDGRPDDVVVMAVERCGRGRLTVAWRDGDLLTGEDEPPRRVRLPGGGADGPVVDIFGAVPASAADPDGMAVDVTVTPVFVG